MQTCSQSLTHIHTEADTTHTEADTTHTEADTTHIHTEAEADTTHTEAEAEIATPQIQPVTLMWHYLGE